MGKPDPASWLHLIDSGWATGLNGANQCPLLEILGLNLRKMNKSLFGSLDYIRHSVQDQAVATFPLYGLK